MPVFCRTGDVFIPVGGTAEFPVVPSAMDLSLALASDSRMCVVDCVSSDDCLLCVARLSGLRAEMLGALYRLCDKTESKLVAGLVGRPPCKSFLSAVLPVTDL
jgi:hypothetical protein